MKIICNNSDLMNAVRNVSKAVPSNTTMSILECILIEASNGVIKLIANDMELGIETILKGSIKQEGMVALEAKSLNELARNLPNGDITITTDEKNDTFFSIGKLNMNLPGRSGEDFSLLPEVTRNESIVISMLSLSELIKQTIFSIGVSESNKIMSGIHMMIKNDQLKITSLDGHRISIRKITLKNIYSEKEVIVPGKTMNEISKIISADVDKDVKIYIDNSYIIFEFEDTVVISRLIEGKYFSVDKMLSSDYETKITLNRKMISDSINRSMIYSKEGNKKPIILDVKDNVLGIEVKSPLGGLKDEVDIEKQGRDITIGFNPKFLLDAMKVIDDEMIDIYFVNPKAPCYIKDVNENYIYMILPVNLN